MCEIHWHGANYWEDDGCVLCGNILCLLSVCDVPESWFNGCNKEHFCVERIREIKEMVGAS